MNVFVLLRQAQHLSHLETLFVYAAAPADTPTPIQPQQSWFISVYQSSETRMEQGYVQTAPGISGPAAGGSTRVHAYE